jgi:hypothetical protein
LSYVQRSRLVAHLVAVVFVSTILTVLFGLGMVWLWNATSNGDPVMEVRAVLVGVPMGLVWDGARALVGAAMGLGLLRLKHRASADAALPPKAMS